MNYMQLKITQRHFNDELLNVKHTFWTDLVTSSEIHIVTDIPPNSSVSAKSTATWTNRNLTVAKRLIYRGFFLLFPKDRELSTC